MAYSEVGFKDNQCANTLKVAISSRCSFWPLVSHLNNVSAIPFGVVDLKGDKIFSLNASALSVIDSHTLSLETKLEEFALRYGHFHLGCLAGHLCINNVM